MSYRYVTLLYISTRKFFLLYNNCKENIIKQFLIIILRLHKFLSDTIYVDLEHKYAAVFKLSNGTSKNCFAYLKGFPKYNSKQYAYNATGDETWVYYFEPVTKIGNKISRT